MIALSLPVPASLVWVEALDGGDPLRKVPQRDKVMRLAAPFSESPAEVFRVKHRFFSLAWTAKEDEALLGEYDRDPGGARSRWSVLPFPARRRRWFST